MGKIGDAQTWQDAVIVGTAWIINNNLPRDTKLNYKRIDDGWEVRFEVWE